ncbi:MAG: HlyD family efflux transporter periplasmic adaptor subunit, partial [Chroococcidiopsidaceae cyanobacterium CP_BM_RX_35]|nr:HlyD family efflux transporter periplasmic adaptor subunit [Chroococcidiopsidaceae cyanobacterium CP_BM_RX_35]
EAQVNDERTKRLAAKGALAQANLDTATLKMRESEAEVSNLEARLEELFAGVKAAQLDLSLSWSSSNFDPKIRFQQLQLDIAERRQALQTLQGAIENTQTELTEAQSDLKRQQAIVIRAPTSGLVWHLDAQVGQFIRAGDSLGKLLDCRQRWVDVYLEERDLRLLKPGMPATIELYGSDSEVFQGRISSVRSGIGRLAVGEDVAVPLIANLPRQSQVRVQLEPETKKGITNLFCYVGYTAKVTFKIR